MAYNYFSVWMNMHQSFNFYFSILSWQNKSFGKFHRFFPGDWIIDLNFFVAFKDIINFKWKNFDWYSILLEWI